MSEFNEQYHTHTHTEYRATTDSSVRLLNEFQEKAIGNIIKHFTLRDNIINLEALILNSDINPMGALLIVKFSINGVEILIKEVIERSHLEDTKFKIFSGRHKDRIIRSNDGDEDSLNTLFHIASDYITGELIKQNKKNTFLNQIK